MKRSFFSFLAFTWLSVGLSLILISCSALQPTTAATPTPQPDIFKTPWEDLSLFKNGLIQSQQSILSKLTNASVYHLEFNLAEDLYHVTGKEEVKYTNAETVPLNEMELRLFPNILGGEMTVTDVRVDEKSVTPKYGLENSLLIVPFAKPLEPNQSIILSMDFAVTAPQSVELNYGVLAYFDNVLALAHAYPMICVYDDEGWNAEIPPQSGDLTYADESFYLVKVTAPKGLTLVTTGQTINSGEASQVQTLNIANGPARDFYLVASPDYTEVSQTFGEVTIHSYAPEKVKKGAQMALDVASRAMKDYGTRYTPFPYTEFDIVSTPTLALGIEYPGMIAIAARIYDVDSDYRGTPARIYMESTIAHETGHQWFYSLVGDDQLDDPWLDESLTQFATLQYYTDEYGESGARGFQVSLEDRWAQVINKKIPIGLPVAKYTAREYGAIVYGRGPLFFVALKDEIGTEAFDAFMKDYAQTLSWKISTPQTLQALAEKHCACDLQKIFDEWVYP
jgi:peptidase M1-like protein